MTRQLFHRELAELQQSVLQLGSMAEKAVLDSMEALRDGDLGWSEKIVADDLLINRKRFEIEERCITVIATQAPLAADLRAIVTILHVLPNLERIADHAEGIARINILLGRDEPIPRRLGYIPAMADRAVAMLRESLQCYVDRDADRARQVADADDEVDRLQDSVYADCIKAMIADPSPENIQAYTYRLWTAHNLERIADRCTNICERVVYLVTGHIEEINVSKY
jgi:phosphate transport system protein